MGQIEKLLPYIENPLSSTILIVAHKDKNVDGRSALAKALKTKSVHVSTKKMYDNKLPEWVMGFIKERGFQINPKAVQIIVDHIEKYIGISKEYNAFEFQDAVAQKNFSKAIKMIQYFESNHKAAPIQLILPTLYAFFNKLYSIYGLGTQDERRIASEVGIAPFLVKNYMAATRHYSYGKVEHILLLIHEYNLRVLGINDASNSDADLLKELVIKIMDTSAK
jgi:DNA polymerase-3 subunit delta